MSIYSGFATRKLEEIYSGLLSQLIQQLCEQIILTFKENDPDISFKYNLHRLTKKMKQMEDNKYLPPKFSESTQHLLDLLQLNVSTPKPPQKQLNLSSQSNPRVKFSLDSKLIPSNDIVTPFIHKLPTIVKLRTETPQRKHQNKIILNISAQDAYVYEKGNQSPYSSLIINQESCKSKSKRQSNSSKKHDQTIDFGVINEEQHRTMRKKRVKKFQLDGVSGVLKTHVRNMTNEKIKVSKTFISIGDTSQYKQIDQQGLRFDFQTPSNRQSNGQLGLHLNQDENQANIKIQSNATDMVQSISSERLDQVEQQGTQQSHIILNQEIIQLIQCQQDQVG